MNKLKYIVPLAAILIAAGTGCRKSQFDINQNINNPTDSTVAYDAVLPAALHTSGTITANLWGTTQNWMGYWARSGTYAPNLIEETYQITTGFGNAIWNNCYDNNYDYEIVAQKANVAGATFYEGIAIIMKALNYQILVDVYGNVPYKDALKGSANSTPTYDKGIDIYKDLFRQIDKGIALIKGATVTANNPNKGIDQNDIMFGTKQYPGSTIAQQKTRWAKFGNTLKLRMLIHCYAVAGIDKAAELAIIATEGSGFLGAGEDAQIQPGYQADKPNPFYNTFYRTVANAQTANNIFFAANEWGITMYDLNHDPRLARFYEAGSDGMRGIPYGLPPVNENARARVAGIGPGLYKTSSSAQVILSGAESLFLQAEARQRNFITTGPTAYQLMRDAVIDNMRFVGVANPATAFATYEGGNLTFPDIDYNTGVAQVANHANGGLFTILSQKWFALNGINSLEVWTDYRRVPYKEVAPALASASTEHFTYGRASGFDAGPTLSVAPANTATRIPVRYLYPQSEYNYNATNVGAEGATDPYKRIFWDLN